jgi:hypothetical protein
VRKFTTLLVIMIAGGQPSLETLHKWAALRSLIAQPQEPRETSWKPVERIRKAAQEKLHKDAVRLKNLLDRSSRSLFPLSDPLSEDFGSHRWLKGQREEVYSDWLAWILEQLPSPHHILKLFQVKSLMKYSGKISVRREIWVPKGNHERTGRIDLVVEVGDQWMIIIEVKMGSAELADTQKQRNYIRSSKAKSASRILLALSGASPTYEKFSLRQWRSLCILLRRMMPDLKKAGLTLIQRTMILSFVGAIEQNVLGFPGLLKLKLNNSYGMSPDLANYLTNCLRDK